MDGFEGFTNWGFGSMGAADNPLNSPHYDNKL